MTISLQRLGNHPPRHLSAMAKKRFLIKGGAEQRSLATQNTIVKNSFECLIASNFIHMLPTADTFP